MSHNNTPHGFTLFEIMVTISLMVLLLTLSSVSYRNTNKRTELIFTAHQVGAMARLAESYAASAKEFNETTSGQNVWGLYFNKADSKKIIMFVDKNENGQSVGDQRYNVGEEFKILTLPSQISVDKILKQNKPDNESGWEEANQAVILFTPPDPKTKLLYVPESGNAWNSADVLRVVLKDQANESVKDIRFNFFGLVDVRL